MSDIHFTQVVKKFGDLTACSNVTLTIKHGCIHSIIGENGAGKSTLVKLLAGIEKLTSGSISLGNKHYSPNSAQDAFTHKIAFIHQHFTLASQLTGLENLCLNYQTNKFSLGSKNESEVLLVATTLLKKFSWNINLNNKVEKISVGEQQRLEILKALMQNPEIIIFDEPTAVLAPQESEELLKFILQLKSEGKTIILISHKLNEIKIVSDQISIMRQGQLIVTKNNSDISIDDMAELMIGRKIIKTQAKPELNKFATPILLPGTAVNLNKSEIFGVAGIEGNGQSCLIEKLLAQFKANNIKYGDITEDRQELSVFNELDLAEHLFLKYKNDFTKNYFINKKKLAVATQKLVTEWDVRPSNIHKALNEFSGGNQQKFMVGRELWSNPDFLLAAHPTRGVDLGAQEKIHQAFFNYIKKANTILLVSSDLDEILYLSDRYVILNNSRVYGPFNKNQLTEKEIGLYMTNDTSVIINSHFIGEI